MKTRCINLATFRSEIRNCQLGLTTALHALEGRESRGDTKDVAKGLLIQLLRKVFKAEADPEQDVNDLAEFLQAGCRAAGGKLSGRQALSAARRPAAIAAKSVVR